MKRTTVELPEALLIAAKKRAADLGRPLRELIESGLRTQLAAPTRPPRRRPIQWVTVEGGLPPGMDVSDRTSIYRKLRRFV